MDWQIQKETKEIVRFLGDLQKDRQVDIHIIYIKCIDRQIDRYLNAGQREMNVYNRSLLMFLKYPFGSWTKKIKQQ